MKFEWDEKKESSKFEKNIIFHLRAPFMFFSDVEAITIFDEAHSDNEDRWITIGRIKNTEIIVVIHTERIHSRKEYIRIISARKADKDETKEYYESIKGRNE